MRAGELTDEIQLRPTTPADVPGILALIDGVYHEYGCVLRAELEEQHLLEPGPYFRRSGGEFWVLERGGEIVGTVGVKLHEDAGELKTLYLHPSIRGRGLGRWLTELAMQHARRAGRARMLLWSDTRFTLAHALYRRMGYTQEGERDLHDSNGSREYGFHRIL